MLQVKGLILYFFLLELKIALNLSPDISYKRGGFFKILLEEGLEFLLSREDGIIAFNLRYMLLLVEVNPISEKQGHKRDVFIAHGFGHVEIILTLLTKIIALYMQAFIVKIEIASLGGAIAGCGTCLKLAMFLAFNK